MMGYYRLKPYHIIVLHYIGRADFKLRIYTPYGFELKSDTSNHFSNMMLFVRLLSKQDYVPLLIIMLSIILLGYTTYSLKVNIWFIIR